MKHLEVCLEEERVEVVTILCKGTGYMAHVKFGNPDKYITVFGHTLEELDVEIIDKVEEVLY